MPENTNWKHVGKVKDAHGLKGELYVLIFSGEAAWVKKLKYFKLAEEIYEVESSKAFKQGLILKPKLITNRNQSEALKGLPFFIPESLLVSQKGETIYLSEIMGFEVFDHEKCLGKIKSTSMNGGHDLLQIELIGGILVEVPFVESFIKEIVWAEKQVRMILPEGLIEIQLQNSTGFLPDDGEGDKEESEEESEE